MSKFILSSLFVFLNTKISVAANLNPLNFFSLFLIADSVCLSCSWYLKEFKISTSYVLAKSLKVCSLFCYLLYVFCSKKFTFFVSLYEGAVGFLPARTCKTLTLSML